MGVLVVLGGFIGLAIGAIAGMLLRIGLAPLLGFAPVFPGPLLPFGNALSPWVGSLGLGWVQFLLLWMIAMIILTAVFYVIAAIAVRPLPTGGVVIVPFTAGERLCFGIMIGINVGINAIFWLSMALPGAIIAVGLSLIGLLVLILPMSQSAVYQVVLGWTSWLMPLAWPATMLGIPFAIVLGIIGLAQFGIGALRFDFTTGSIEITFIGPVTADTGFSLGHFNFLVAAPGTALVTIQASTPAQDIPAHESGHTLNTGAFGSAFLAINAIEENIVPPNGANAYGELCTESNSMDTNRLYILLWS